MAVVLAEGGGALDRMVREAEAAGQILDRDMIRRAEELDDRFDDLSRSVSTIFKAAAVEAASAGSALVEFGSEVARIRGLLQTKLPTFENAIAALGGLIAQLAAARDQAAGLNAELDRESAVTYGPPRRGSVHPASSSAITPQLESRINDLAASYARAAEEAGNAAAELRQIEDDSRRGATAMADLFEGIMQGGDAARRALAQLIAPRGHDLHLVCDPGRDDGAEPRAVRCAVFRAGLAQGQGFGRAAAGCGGMNQGVECRGHRFDPGL